MAETVLISGGTGLLGSNITQFLQRKGYKVIYLSRKKGKKNGIKCYQWDVAAGTIDAEAVIKADHIIHLAGASVADKRWTDEYKREILESRTKSTALICRALKENKHKVKSFISASAIGIYGNRGKELLDEESEVAGDFLAQVCVAWEDEIFKFEVLGIRTVAIRIGIVLSEKGGALPQLILPVKMFVGAPLGGGDQYMSWIHIEDLSAIFVKALEDKNMKGVYNGVSPTPVTNEVLTKAIADKISRPVFPINVPGFALKVIVGEFADSLIGGARVSSHKIEKVGFSFAYPDIDKALDNLI